MTRNRELVLLTGTTGYVGGRLLRALQADGRRLRCMARGPEYLRSRVGEGTEVAAGDVLKPDTLPAGPAGRGYGVLPDPLHGDLAALRDQQP